MRDVAQLVDRLVDALADPVQLAADHVVRTLTRQTKLDVHRDESLLDAVVQVALELAALVVGGGHDPSS